MKFFQNAQQVGVVRPFVFSVVEIHENPPAVVLDQLGDDMLLTFARPNAPDVDPIAGAFSCDADDGEVVAGILAVEKWIEVDSGNFTRIVSLLIPVFLEQAKKLGTEDFGFLPERGVHRAR